MLHETTSTYRLEPDPGLYRRMRLSVQLRNRLPGQG